MLYHLSVTNMNNKTLIPRIPDCYFTRNGYEDNKTPRVCFTPSIDCSLGAIGNNLENNEFYVHVPKKKIKTKKPTIKEVPDCDITKEVWCLEPVELKCIGKIKVDKAIDDYKTFKYGNKTADLYFWNWHWIKKYSNINESVISNIIMNYFTEWR